jgi:vancomycin permeability regulator SanA
VSFVPEAAVHAAAGLGTVLVLLTSLGLALTWSRVVREGRLSGGGPADLIVVFGARTYPDGRPSPELEARLAHAATLYREGHAASVVCSGGHAGYASEPRVMRATLIRLGVPAEAILIHETGSSTRLSIAGVKDLTARGRTTVLAVSSPYHLHRILIEARRQGVNAVGSAAPSTPIMRRFVPRTRQRAREVAAIWWYAMTPPRWDPGRLAATMGHSPMRPVNDPAPARRLG